MNVPRALILVLGLAAACSSSATSLFRLPPDGGIAEGGGADAGPGIVIESLTFSPLNLRVAPGETVTVFNKDPVEHTVTSQPAVGEWVQGEVNGVSFDTGPILDQGSFTIPANAPRGTVVPYFCNIQKGNMHNTGFVTVE